MSKEKCKFYKKQFLSKYCELFKQPCYGKHCNFIKEFTRLNDLEQQLKTAKEENEKLTIQNTQLNTALGARANGKRTFIDLAVDNETLTQQNKQLRENINNIKNLCNEDWEDMTVDKFQNQLLQSLKEVNNEK